MTAPTMTTGRRRRPAVNRDGSDWTVSGACRGKDDLFFPSGNSAAAQQQTERAKAVCGRCPVRTQCLEWALTTGQVIGVLGGLSASERLKLGRVLPVGGRSLQAGAESAPAHDRCVAARDFVEEQLAAGVSQRQVARWLGVGHHTLSRARSIYLAEESTGVAV